VKTKFKKKNWK